MSDKVTLRSDAFTPTDLGGRRGAWLRETAEVRDPLLGTGEWGGGSPLPESSEERMVYYIRNTVVVERTGENVCVCTSL